MNNTVVVENNSSIVGKDGRLIESLGIETLGGVFTPIIPPGEKVPCRKQEIFSTAADNQEQVEIALYRGSKEKVKDNHFLGKFQIVDIPPQPKGYPLIEVTFEISGKDITMHARDSREEDNIRLKKVEVGKEIKRRNAMRNEAGEKHIAQAGAIADKGIGASEHGSILAFKWDHGTMLEIQSELEAALQADPGNPEYKYLLACAKVAGGMGKTGFDEVCAIAADHPEFEEAAGYAANPDKWRGPFLYPAWNENMRQLHPSILAESEAGCLVRSVQDGCRRVVSFFRRLPRQSLGPNFKPALRSTVRLAFMQTPHGAVSGAYVLIDTHPIEPYTSETILNAETYPADWNDVSMSGNWLVRLLAQQEYTYAVLAEPSGSVYFNRKIDFDSKTKSNLNEAAKQVASLKLSPSDDPARFQKSQMAQQYFMNHLSMDTIQF